MFVRAYCSYVELVATYLYVVIQLFV
jgi:hypothetical protein